MFGKLMKNVVSAAEPQGNQAAPSNSSGGMMGKAMGRFRRGGGFKKMFMADGGYVTGKRVQKSYGKGAK